MLSPNVCRTTQSRSKARSDASVQHAWCCTDWFCEQVALLVRLKSHAASRASEQAVIVPLLLSCSWASTPLRLALNTSVHVCQDARNTKRDARTSACIPQHCSNSICPICPICSICRAIGKFKRSSHDIAVFSVMKSFLCSQEIEIEWTTAAANSLSVSSAN